MFIIGFVCHSCRQMLDSWVTHWVRQSLSWLLTGPPLTRDSQDHLWCSYSPWPPKESEEKDGKEGADHPYPGLGSIPQLRAFRVFRRYRGAPFPLSYSLFLFKDKLIHSFNNHFRSPSFVEGRVTLGVSNKFSDCKFNSKCTADMCCARGPCTHAVENQRTLLEYPSIIYPKSYWVFFCCCCGRGKRGGETLDISWTNELFRVFKKKKTSGPINF